jgi:hypothetical protein
MIARRNGAHAVRADAPGALGEPWLAGEDPRPGAARAAARHYPAPHEGVALGPLLLIEPGGRASGAFGQLAATRLRSESEIRGAIEHRRRRAVWITPNVRAERLLVAALSGRAKGDQRLLSLGSANGAPFGLLHAIFRFVVAAGEGVRLLPTEDLADVLNSQNCEDLFVGAAAAPNAAAVILYRGNLEPIVVPLAWFGARPGGPRPDPHRLAIADSGQTVRLGDYEASADAILYELDDAYRRRAKKRAIDQDRSFGGALRRLRLQKGLGREDFPGINAKEIARIERGEVKKPHAETIAVIAKRTGVPASRIGSF